MEIIRTSRLTGKTHVMDLPITEVELVDFSKGTNPEDAFPNLTKQQIDFFMYGVVPEESNQISKMRQGDGC